MQRRSRLEVYLDILMVLSGGPMSPTKLMYSTNLSWKPLNQCVKNLLEQGIIIQIQAKSANPANERRRRLYTLTLKGNDILKRYQEFMKDLALKQ
jgi:predicted transcriptional regulator